MKITKTIFLVFLLLFLYSCKKQETIISDKTNSIEITKSKEQIRLGGYRETKWGMSIAEVEKVLNTMGMKETSELSMEQKEGFYYVTMKEDKPISIFYNDTFVEMRGHVWHFFEDSKLSRVLIGFNDKDYFEKIGKFISDKYGNPKYASSDSKSMWDLKDTIIELTINAEGGPLSASSFFFGDLVLIYTDANKYYQKVVEQLAPYVKRLNDLKEKEDQAKKKF